MPIPKVIIGCKNCHCPLSFMDIIEKTTVDIVVKTKSLIVNLKNHEDKTVECRICNKYIGVLIKNECRFLRRKVTKISYQVEN